jgi:hypothetical protein
VYRRIHDIFFISLLTVPINNLHSWVRLLKQQFSIIVYHLPTVENKILISVSISSKQTEVSCFHCPFAANKQKLLFYICSVCSRVSTEVDFWNSAEVAFFSELVFTSSLNSTELHVQNSTEFLGKNYTEFR